MFDTLVLGLTLQGKKKELLVGSFMIEGESLGASLVPRLSRFFFLFFFVLWFVVSIIHGSGRVRKMGKASEHFMLFCFRVLYLTQTEEQKKKTGESQGTRLRDQSETEQKARTTTSRVKLDKM